MKKTIIALLGLGGIAMGGNILPVITDADTNIKSYFDFESSKDPTINNGLVWNNSVSWTEGNGYA